tara:strand:- start:3512 stop:3976 length:465 start_codon:yes stop_codon:yes gene_type:complete
MDLAISEFHLRKPPWRERNKLIAKQLEKNKTVIDIGGGGANLLNYYTPSKYLCIDGMSMPEVDITIDLNSDYQNQVPDGWDYAVNSGILEYIDDVPSFLDKQKKLASKYIFTWFPDKIHGLLGHDWVVPIIEENYTIQNTIPWGIQKVYECDPK